MVEQQNIPKLRVYNSFTKEKDLFQPVDPTQVTWYTCGPTVYDDSHLGHARTYVSFDIIKRIMTDYFGYNVKLVMNITDIEDKIIRKSIEQGRDFNELSRYYETSFLDDMRRLNVALPESITRVSEFVPEIVDYIVKIIDNGYAYESNGSVYFDVTKFKNEPNHTYAKLEPTSATNKELRDEGEGVLTSADASEKRSEQDFALWKKSKEGEPNWDSPWGLGRPGWHIECSAMASAIFKKYPIDIHSGGVDLRFPHHDNEIAQSEAYYQCDNWINHFWHTGHLHIAGKKMSKSLKNFITIKQILEEYNPRVVRFLFLIHSWNSLMNYTTEKSFPEAVAKERKFTEFFRTVKSTIRNIEIRNTNQKWNETDEQLSASLHHAKTQVHEALCDSFDTPRAVNELARLCSDCSVYLQQPVDKIKVPLVKQASGFVFKTLKAFGVYAEDDMPQVLGDGREESAAVDVEASITPLMNILTEYRDKMKANAAEGPKTIFQLSDQLRDDILPFLGIQLEDKKQGEPATWKFVNKDDLLKEREAKIQAKNAKEQEKAVRAALELKKKSCPPEMWFKEFRADEFSQYDDRGVPTHNNKEKELSEAIRNKLSKDWTKQQGVYEKWRQTQVQDEENKE